MIEDYARYLAAEAKSDIAALHQFRILYDPAQRDLHFFFEGEEDSLFYMPEARRRLDQRNVNIYDCGGKKNVIEVRDTLKLEGYDIQHCLFFVDRDLDDFLNTQVELDEYTYITDFYSIENYVSTPQVARVLLQDVIRISAADPEFNRIVNSISASFGEFYSRVRPLMSWILAAKEQNCKPNLNNTNGLKGIVRVVEARPVFNQAGFAEFKKKVVVDGRIPTVSAILRWRRALDLGSPKLWVRGKYDIWFFQVILIAALEETSRRRKEAGGRAVRVPSSVREGRIFETLGGRIAPPASLQAFLQDRL